MEGASVRDARHLARAGVLDSTSSTASERNDVLAHLMRTFTVGWWEMRARVLRSEIRSPFDLLLRRCPMDVEIFVRRSQFRYFYLA